MKKIVVVLCFLFLSGCTYQTEPYPFPNQGQEIIKIEMVYNENPGGEGTNTALFSIEKTLVNDEAKAFADAVYRLETSSARISVLWGYGQYIAIVYYTNGDVEYWGTANIEFVEIGKEATGYSQYGFSNHEDFEHVFIEYLYS